MKKNKKAILLVKGGMGFSLESQAFSGFCHENTGDEHQTPR